MNKTALLIPAITLIVKKKEKPNVRKRIRENIKREINKKTMHRIN